MLRLSLSFFMLCMYVNELTLTTTPATTKADWGKLILEVGGEWNLWKEVLVKF